MNRINKEVAMPLKIAWVAPSLLAIEASIALLALIIVQNVLAGIVVMVIGHTYCMYLTSKEPHFDYVLAEKARKVLGGYGINLKGYPPSKTKNTWENIEGNLYEP